jgi:hypothetical protein
MKRKKKKKNKKIYNSRISKQTTYKIRHIKDHFIRRVYNVKSHSEKLFRTKRNAIQILLLEYNYHQISFKDIDFQLPTKLFKLCQIIR